MGRSSLLRHNLNATLTSFQLSTPKGLKLVKEEMLDSQRQVWHSLVRTEQNGFCCILVVDEIEKDIFEGANQCRSNLDIIYRCVAQNRIEKEKSTFHGS